MLIIEPDPTPKHVCIYSRFPLGRLRSSISSGKQVPLKSHCLSAETEKPPEIEAPDYLPLVSCEDLLYNKCTDLSWTWIHVCGVSSGAPAAGIRSLSSDGHLLWLCPNPLGPSEEGFTLQPPSSESQPALPLHVPQCSLFIILYQTSL